MSRKRKPDDVDRAIEAAAKCDNVYDLRTLLARCPEIVGVRDRELLCACVPGYYADQVRILLEHGVKPDLRTLIEYVDKRASHPKLLSLAHASNIADLEGAIRHARAEFDKVKTIQTGRICIGNTAFSIRSQTDNIYIMEHFLKLKMQLCERYRCAVLSCAAANAMPLEVVDIIVAYAE